MTTENKFNFCRAGTEDIKDVVAMIQELADFENMSNGPQLTEKDLIRDAGLDGSSRELCHIYVVSLQQNNKEKLIIGYSICYFSYSTWQGKSYFLEDIYVHPAYRGIGAGAHIIRELAKIANEYQCKRLDFHVLAWNPARSFYEKLGAIDLTTAEEWHFYRIPEEGIKKLAQQLQNE